MRSEAPFLKVLYVINGLGTGGAERSLAEMIEPLASHGVSVTVACLFERAEGVQDEVRGRGHDVRFLGSGWFKRWRQLRSLIKESNPDVIHTTIFEADLLGRLASIGGARPVITSIVNPSYDLPVSDHPDVKLWKLRAVRWLDGLTARHLTTRFHALSQSVADSATRTLGIDPNRIHVIPRGRSRLRLGEPSLQRRQRVRAAMGLEDSSELLLCVGRREHQKGQTYAVRAMAELVDSRPGLVLVIAGRDGGASESLKKEVQAANLGDRVRFLGHRDDVPDLMVAADILVFPSLYEGIGGTLIEAMALELPIVASDIAPLREVTMGAALLVEPGSSGALASGIERLLSDSDLRQALRIRGRERFEADLTIEMIARRMAQLYHDVAVELDDPLDRAPGNAPKKDRCRQTW